MIKSLDLAVPAGQITIILGPNGCGKSTLLKAMGRLLKPKGGEIYLGAQAIRNLSTKAIAKRLSLLPQSPTAPEGLTVAELVAQGRYPHKRWLQHWTRDDAREIDRALALTQMREFAHCSLDNLSGGQRQRAWIAMTLAQNTEIMLLDEPMTYLDLAYQMEILDLLYDLNKQEKRTIVMVLHDLNQACRYGDFLVVLQSGKIYDQGSPTHVMNEQMLDEVFGVNSRIVNDPVAGTPMCIPIGRKRATDFSVPLYPG